MPEVTSVRRWDAEGGRPLTLTGIQAPDQLHYFDYELGSASATLLVSTDFKGEATLSQHRCSINRPLPPGEIEAVRPVMVEIEKALEERCGVELPEISEHMSE